MHFLGLSGMPRRIPDYPDAYEGWNKVASLGSMMSMLSIILFLYIVYDTITGVESEEKRIESRIINFFTGEELYGRIKGERTLDLSLRSLPGYHHFDHIPSVNGINKGNNKRLTG